jgi:hypothetical protein
MMTECRLAKSHPAPGQLVLALLLLTFAQLPALAADAATGDFLNRYCEECHNTVDWVGGLAFELLDHVEVGNDAAAWEKVVTKLRTGMMPPPGAPRPAAAGLADVAGTLETALDTAALRQPRTGTAGLRRLTRTEYANAIRDLLALDANVASLLPADNKSEGFDTIGDTLGSSPTLIDAYASAAIKLSRRALGDREAPAVQVDYRPATGWSQDEHVEGLPFGTRGGFLVEHEFPLDGVYEFNVATASGTLFGNALPQGTELYLTLDDEPLRVEDPRSFRIPVTAGPHRFGVAMVDRMRHLGTDDIYTIEKRLGAVAGVAIIGPFEAQGPGDTPSRRRVLVCQPASSDTEVACARRILHSLASRAYRQPLGEQDASVEALMTVYHDARTEGDFEYGIEQALTRILVNPRFLFRLETAPVGAVPGSVYRVSDVELASRLSFFLWSSIPDATLLEAAATGRLQEPAELQAQVQRMLADPRASALVSNFAAQWLHLDALGNTPVEEFGFDENLRQALRRETELLVDSVLREDRSVLTLLDADYTYLDEQLARHYGIDGVRGSYMRRVSLAGHDARRGLLGQGSILALTSMVDRTSPVVRGKWIMENLLGAPVPAPPPGVETNLEPMDEAGRAPSTLRARLEVHREQPACASCHNIMDPIGFALENFDRTGQWRSLDMGTPIDSRGELMDGTPLSGPADLRAWMTARPDLFVRNLAGKLLIYALGRSVDHHDMPLVRELARQAAANDYRFSALVTGIVNSEAFQTRQLPPAVQVTRTQP